MSPNLFQLIQRSFSRTLSVTLLKTRKSLRSLLREGHFFFHNVPDKNVGDRERLSRCPSNVLRTSAGLRRCWTAKLEASERTNLLTEDNDNSQGPAAAHPLEPCPPPLPQVYPQGPSTHGVLAPPSLPHRNPNVPHLPESKLHTVRVQPGLKLWAC